MILRNVSAAVFLAAFAALPFPSRATPMLEPIAYTLRFPDARNHYVDLEARIPTDGRPEVELAMAVWTPGSYLVREFARNVEALAVHDASGAALAVEKVAKNRWRIETGGAATVTVAYRLYCREMSVRTDFVDASFALLNGAATFLRRVDGADDRPFDVRLELPAGWSRSISALPAAPGGGPDRYLARDFDTLVDSPIYAGTPAVHPLDVPGAPHLLVDEGEGDTWDGKEAAKIASRAASAVVGFWGTVPYDRYVFFNILSETGGGLEHKASTVLMTSRFKLRTREGRLDWASLVTHEFFHAWNVKRLRPRPLGPFDYEHEVYTRSLWIAEGLTAYYDDLLPRRAGLSSDRQYLKRLSKTIGRLQETPGRRVQPLELASFDAWIKQYRPDENSINSAVSYYTKGAVVGFLLDAEIRRRTGGDKNLDDVLRTAYARYSGARGYTPEEFREVASEVAGSDLAVWLERALDSTAELDYGPALAWYGLRFATDEEAENSGPKKDKDEEPAAWLGIETAVRDGRLEVTQVERGTPAWEAGLSVDDELLAIGDDRIPPQGLEERLKLYRPGTRSTLLVARRDRLLRLPITFGKEPEKRWRLVPDPAASAAQKAHRAVWLAGAPGPPESGGEASSR